MILRLSAWCSQTAEVKNRPWPCILLLMFWCSFSLVGCTVEAFLSTHWSGCKSRIVKTQGLTTGHVEKLNKKKFEWIHKFLCSKRCFVLWFYPYLRGGKWQAFDRGVFWRVPTVVYKSTAVPFICRWLILSLSPLLSHHGRWWRAESVHAGVGESHRLALARCSTLPTHHWDSGSIYWVGKVFCAPLQGRTNLSGVSGLWGGASLRKIKAGHITPGQRVLQHQNVYKWLLYFSFGGE